MQHSSKRSNNNCHSPRLPWQTVLFLPKEDMALVMRGNKVTGNISSPLRYHAIKEVVRQYLRMRTKDNWSNNKFDAVDWEHLDLAL